VKRLGAPPYICLITKGESDPSNYASQKPKILETIREAAADGVHLIQIREKALSARLLFDLVSDAVRIAAKTGSLIVVNDRADISIASGADGVHLPGNSISPKLVRNTFASELVIGVSTHSVEQARLAAESGADYVFFGPIFETPGKPKPVGPGVLENVCSQLGTFPVIALGGIDQNNVKQVLRAGAAGIAAIRALNEKESRRSILKVVAETARNMR